MFTSRNLKIHLSNLRAFLEYTYKNTSGQLKLQEDESEFSLVLSNIADLNDFAEKLKALQSLYFELCNLLGVSNASHPIRIGKIEYGSLWTRLFGDTRAIGLMAKLLEESARYLHRNYTKEGKLTSLPKKLESLETILNFSNRLKESGVDVSLIQEELAKGAVLITNSLNTLIADQPRVEVNGQTISLGYEAQKALLGQSATAKIEYTHSPDTTPALNPPSENSK